VRVGEAVRLLLPPATFEEMQRASANDVTMTDLLRAMFAGEAFEALMSLLRSGVKLDVVVMPELDAAYLEIESAPATWPRFWADVPAEDRVRLACNIIK
jgi:hypothetical protein